MARVLALLARVFAPASAGAGVGGVAVLALCGTGIGRSQMGIIGTGAASAATTGAAETCVELVELTRDELGQVCHAALPEGVFAHSAMGHRAGE